MDDESGADDGEFRFDPVPMSPPAPSASAPPRVPPIPDFNQHMVLGSLQASAPRSADRAVRGTKKEAAANEGAENARAQLVEQKGHAGDATVETMLDELRQGLAAYAQLLDDFQAGRIDEATLRREAFKAGLVVKGDNAWLLDPVNMQWHHYDGFELRTLPLLDQPS